MIVGWWIVPLLITVAFPFYVVFVLFRPGNDFPIEVPLFCLVLAPIAIVWVIYLFLSLAIAGKFL